MLQHPPHDLFVAVNLAFSTLLAGARNPCDRASQQLSQNHGLVVPEHTPSSCRRSVLEWVPRAGAGAQREIEPSRHSKHRCQVRDCGGARACRLQRR